MRRKDIKHSNETRESDVALEKEHLIQKIKDKEKEQRDILLLTLKTFIEKENMQNIQENQLNQVDEMRSKYRAILELMDDHGILSWNEYNFRISLPSNDQYNVIEVVLTIPETLDMNDAALIITAEHEILMDRLLHNTPGEDLYGINGMDPEVLLLYVSQKYGWNFTQNTPDIEITLKN